MKKYFLFAFVFTLLALSTATLAQSTNWADYGLSEETVKYLSETEKQNILKSPTPTQTIQKAQEEIKKNGTTSAQKLYPFLDLSTPDAPLGPEVVNCFDYYTFGSVDADMTSQSSNATAGMTMNFFGNIKNKNAYPIVSGTLYVKIFRNVGGEKNPNGPDVVDQFVAVDNITLSANDSVPVKFSWKVPAYAQSGKYQLVTYFTADKKFNLLGLSFTDDIVGNSFNFNVSGEKTGVAFDKSSVMINKAPYYFAAYPPKIQPQDDANISIKIDNTTNQAQSIKTNWKLYRWDGANPSNLIREFSTTTAIKANSIGDIKFSIQEKSEPVYYLVGEFIYKDAKSVVGIRFVRDGVDRVRLNFPSVTSFPLKKGDSTTLFSCLHNSGQSSQVPNNKIVLEITDENGKIIESYTYEGVVTGDVMAVKKDFVSKVNLDIFSVHASLYTDGKLVDESTMRYDCNEIDPTKCIPENKWIGLIAFLGGILALILIFIFMKLSKRNKNIVVPVAMLIIGACLFSPSVTEAKSAPWNKLENVTLLYFWNNAGAAGTVAQPASGWGKGLVNPNITIKYNVEIRDFITNMLITDGASVSVGSKIVLKFLPHKSEDIYWFGTGYSTDSPYGDWIANTAPPVAACLEKDFNGNTTWRVNQTVGVYIPLVVSPPTKTITGLDNLSCDTLTGSESGGYSMNCTVVSAGSINPQFNFGATAGKFYYRYLGKNDRGVSGCYANQIAMEKDGGTRRQAYLNNNEDVYGHASNPYTLSVPVQNISYSIIATTSVVTMATTTPLSDPEEFKIVCSANPSVAGANVTFTAISSNASGTVTYLWNDGATGNTKIISGGYATSGLHPTPTENQVFVTGTDSSGAKSTISCDVSVGCYTPPDTTCVDRLRPTYTCSGMDWVQDGSVACDPPGWDEAVDSLCYLDGIEMASGTTKIFYMSRISNECLGEELSCRGGKWIDKNGEIADTDKYKYRSCVEPAYNEF
jgi:hypothetical protein